MRGLVPEDVYRFRWASDPRLSPDGNRFAYVVVSIDQEENEYRPQIWMADVSAVADSALPFTSGKHKESKPRWSPDGSWLAYVAHHSDEGSELMVISTAGGEARELLHLEEDFDDIAWSPDGSRIAFVARSRDEERYAKKKEKDQSPRRITRTFFRLDNVGWTIDRPTQLFVINTDGSNEEPTQLTKGEFSVGGLSWSPDGDRIAFCSGRHDTWDRDLFSDIFVIGSQGGEPERITDTDSSYSSASWGPDGKIAFTWTPDPVEGPWHSRIGIIDPNSRNTSILTHELDLQAEPFPALREPVWFDSKIWFAAEDSGNVHLYRTDPSNGVAPELVIGGTGGVTGFDIAGGNIVFTRSTPTHLSDVHVAKLTDLPLTDPQPLLGVDEETFSDVELSQPERFIAKSSDGTEVEAWIVRPAGFKEGERYPALLNIHGGPFTQYSNKFFDEFHAYAGAGYVVIYANPRGSSGYSEAWGRAIKGPKTKDPGTGWGACDYDDLMAVVDEAVSRFSFIDAGRLGVMGGSYGGYMTSWIISHNDRFKAAISERAVNNMLTMAHASDVATYFGKELGPSYLDDPQEYLRVSPITYVKNIKTPVLIMHSEQDLRCPIEQGEQLFMALKSLGKEVEFVRFPGESHELSRSGAPLHRVQRFEIVIEWFDRFLKN
ncbi:MAG: prolyl oligopeptidase family serine peptidase [Actinomycetota bacterium]|nr:S9 family peptidase [Actinomycetota bacterium]